MLGVSHYQQVMLESRQHSQIPHWHHDPYMGTKTKGCFLLNLVKLAAAMLLVILKALCHYCRVIDWVRKSSSESLTWNIKESMWPLYNQELCCKQGSCFENVRDCVRNSLLTGLSGLSGVVKEIISLWAAVDFEGRDHAESDDARQGIIWLTNDSQRPQRHQRQLLCLAQRHSSTALKPRSTVDKTPSLQEFLHWLCLPNIIADVQGQRVCM